MPGVGCVRVSDRKSTIRISLPSPLGQQLTLPSVSFHPFEPLLRRLPEGWRTPVEWLATIGLAVGAILVVKVEVANPYRIPSPSMEPTLHCARPAVGCMGAHSDRVVANRFIYRFRDPRRGEIVVFEPRHGLKSSVVRAVSS